MALKRAVWVRLGLESHSHSQRRLFGRGVLRHGLGALGHSVLGQLSGQDEAHRGLDLAGGDGGALVVVGQTGRLCGDALEHVVDELE